MADYLLDTNILSYWYNSTSPQNESVVANIKRVRQPDARTGYVSRLFISVVTSAEIDYGHKVSSSPGSAGQVEFRTFVDQQLPPALEIPNSIREPYSTLRSWLFNQYSRKEQRARARRAEELFNPTTARELGIDENDLWIAAHAALYGFVLVTADRLARIATAIESAGIGPEVEDWTKP